MHSLFAFESSPMLVPGQVRSRGLLFRDSSSPIRAVGYIPEPIGTFINTATFSTPLLLAAILVPRLRTRRRLRRGLCPRCAYNLHADFAFGCPECGWNRS